MSSMMVEFEVSELELFEVLEKLEKLFYPHQITEVIRGEKYTIVVSTGYDPPELLRLLKEHGLLEYLFRITR